MLIKSKRNAFLTRSDQHNCRLLSPSTLVPDKLMIIVSVLFPVNPCYHSNLIEQCLFQSVHRDQALFLILTIISSKHL